MRRRRKKKRKRLQFLLPRGHSKEIGFRTSCNMVGKGWRIEGREEEEEKEAEEEKEEEDENFN